MTEKTSKYGEVNSYSYNKEVIDRLKRKGKISQTKANLFEILAITGAFLDKTKLKYIADIGFIKDTQYALFGNMAIKIKGNQNNLFGVQYANKVGNQYQLGGLFGIGGIQWAGTVLGNQEQIIGLIQKADEVEGDQIQLGWIFKGMFWPVQYANKVGNQYQLGGVQKADEVKGDQIQLGGIQIADEVKGVQYNIYGGIQYANKAKKQENIIGIQYGKNIIDQFTGVLFQYGSHISGEQLNGFGLQYANKTNNQTIGTGIQLGKVLKKKENWFKEMIKDSLSKNKK